MAIISTASAAAASSTIDSFTHARRKASRPAAITGSSVGVPSQGRATTQGLLGNLLQSLEQVIGISVTASAASAPRPAVSAAAPGDAGASRPVGTNVNTLV